MDFDSPTLPAVPTLDLDRLRAIASDPDDDGPRLQLADALTAQGDPYGEWIRLQCEIATLERTRDTGEGTRRGRTTRHALTSRLEMAEARQTELQNLYIEGFERPFAARCIRWAWRRGFVSELVIDAVELQAMLPTLSQVAPALEHLTIVLPRGFAPEDSAIFGPHCTALQSLKLASEEPPSATLWTALARADEWFPRLQRLDVRWLHANIELLTALRSTKHLGAVPELVLAGNRVTVEMACVLGAIPAFLHGLIALESCHVNASVIDALAKTPCAEGTTRMMLTNNPIGASGVEALLRGPWSLRHLVLDDAEIDSLALRALASAPWITRLATLEARNARLGDTDALRAFAAALGPNASLTNLALDRSELGDDGLAELVPTLPLLNTLSLASCGLTDRSARALARSGALSELSSLVLRGNRFTDEVATIFEHAAFRLSLRMLDVGDMNLTARAKLRQTFPYAAIRTQTLAAPQLPHDYDRDLEWTWPTSARR